MLITRNRREELLATLGRLAGVRVGSPVVVVDNASGDGTAAAVRSRFPDVTVLALPWNAGAVGRNLGARLLACDYVAFCDDDTWWSPGSLRRAAEALDAHPSVGLVTARIVVEPRGEEDPICEELRHSPLGWPAGLPGPRLASFLAGASVIRRAALFGAGGFSERLVIGGEEELLASDLAAGGWEMCFLEGATVHHRASSARDPHQRRRQGIRNTLWYGWLRRPAGAALTRTWRLGRRFPPDAVSAAGVVEALAGLPWVLGERRPVPAPIEARYRRMDAAQATSRARRYVS